MFKLFSCKINLSEEGSAFRISSEEDDEDIPTWFQIARGGAVVSQLLLITTAILFLFTESNKKGIRIARITLCACSGLFLQGDNRYLQSVDISIN